MLSAPGGSGKSNLALALSCHAALARGFLGQPPPPSRARVVYIGIDAASWDHAHVARRIARGMGVDPVELDIDNEEWTGGILFCFEPILLQEGHFETLLNAAAMPDGRLPDLVVIDSLRNIHDRDENDSTAMMAVMRFFRRWAERNCSVLLLHHSRKPGEFTHMGGWDSARGSTVIHNSVDTHVVLRPLTPKKGTLGVRNAPIRRVEVIWVKGRGGDAPPITRYKCVWDAEMMRFEPLKRGRPMGQKTSGTPSA